MKQDEEHKPKSDTESLVQDVAKGLKLKIKDKMTVMTAMTAFFEKVKKTGDLSFAVQIQKIDKETQQVELKS